MPPFKTFSKRQKRREQAGQPDVYQYDELPMPFRIQVLHIWRSLNETVNYNHYSSLPSDELWGIVSSTLACELGVHSLGPNGYAAFNQVTTFIQSEDRDGVLDLIDLAFRAIGSEWFSKRYASQISADTQINAIDELNHRFREHSIGYQFTGGELIKVDSAFVHAEIIKPAISLLHNHGFRGPEEEFLRAHEHHRHGRNKEAINEALKAFESTIKAICEARNWSYDKTGAASKLIATISNMA